MSRGPQQSLMRRQLDAKLDPFRQSSARLQAPSKGWLRAIRRALGLTQAQLARRMNLARSSLVELEQREAAGTVTLQTLRRLADGLECDLVCYLMPRKRLTQIIEQQAYAYAQRVMNAVAHSMALEAQGVEAEECEAQIRDLAEKLVRDTDSRIWDAP